MILNTFKHYKTLSLNKRNSYVCVISKTNFHYGPLMNARYSLFFFIIKNTSLIHRHEASGSARIQRLTMWFC